MNLQELVNKLANILASIGGVAGVRINGKHIRDIVIEEVDGVRIVNIISD